MFKVNRRKSGKIKLNALFKAVHGLFLNFDLFFRAFAFSAEFQIVGIKYNLVLTCCVGNADSIVGAFNRGEVAYNDDFVSFFIHSSKSDYRVCIVVA